MLDQVLPEKNKDVNEAYAELLEDIRHFNINTVKKLKDVITRNWDDVSEHEANIVSEYSEKPKNEREKKRVFFTHVGLVRVALEAEFGDGFRDYNRKMSKARRGKKGSKSA